MNDAIIDKIKKLLRMKRGGTAAEIETALALAQELAAKHGIDIKSINPDEETRRITEHDVFAAARLQWECKYAVLVCEHFFNVSGLIVQSRVPFRWGMRSVMGIRFIGTSWDIQIATYVYHFLVRHFRREWTQRRGRCRNRQAFLYGMYHGLCHKLDARRKASLPSENAIMVLGKALTERKQYLALHYGELKQQSSVPDGDAQLAKYRGFIAGQETEINPGIGAPGGKPQSIGRSLQPLLGF